MIWLIILILGLLLFGVNSVSDKEFVDSWAQASQPNPTLLLLLAILMLGFIWYIKKEVV